MQSRRESNGGNHGLELNPRQTAITDTAGMPQLWSPSPEGYLRATDERARKRPDRETYGLPDLWRIAGVVLP